MKITQITAIGGNEGGLVFGLGDDQKMYYWCTSEGMWVLDKTKVS